MFFSWPGQSINAGVSLSFVESALQLKVSKRETGGAMLARAHHRVQPTMTLSSVEEECEWGRRRRTREKNPRNLGATLGITRAGEFRGMQGIDSVQMTNKRTNIGLNVQLE